MEGDQYYGAKATINVWKPKIEQSNEFSLSQIWLLGGNFGEDLNSIEAGWQVNFHFFFLFFSRIFCIRIQKCSFIFYFDTGEP